MRRYFQHNRGGLELIFFILEGGYCLVFQPPPLLIIIAQSLRTFRKFKTIENYKCEDYLRQVTNVQHRITLTKLRLSNHKLAIETGRYVRPYKKPEDRICPICKKDVEDEIYFLTLCPAYQEK